jgi:hypothetical protein
MRKKKQKKKQEKKIPKTSTQNFTDHNKNEKDMINLIG